MMKRFVGVLLVCLAASAGSAAEVKWTETPYYPLQVGTTWHYKAGEGKITVRVTKHEKVGETLCARLEVTRDGKAVGSQHLAVTAEGVYCHDLTFRTPNDPASGKEGEREVTQTPTPPTCLLKLPPKKDERWKVDSKGKEGKIFQAVFQVGEEDVTVPAGTYEKAIRVTSVDLEVNGLRPNIITHYASGVGMVKQVIKEGNVRTEIVLEKFEPGKK